MKMTKDIATAAESMIQAINCDRIASSYGGNTDFSTVWESMCDMTEAENAESICDTLDSMTNGDFLLLCDFIDAMKGLTASEKQRRAGYFK